MQTKSKYINRKDNVLIENFVGEHSKDGKRTEISEFCSLIHIIYIETNKTHLTKDYHLFDIIINTRFEMMNQCP